MNFKRPSDNRAKGAISLIYYVWPVMLRDVKKFKKCPLVSVFFAELGDKTAAFQV